MISQPNMYKMHVLPIALWLCRQRKGHYSGMKCCPVEKPPAHYPHGHTLGHIKLDIMAP